MRLAFWRAGKDMAVVQRALAKPAAAVKPAPPLRRAVRRPGSARAGHALMRKRSWILVPTVLALVLSLAAVNMVTPRYKSEARILIDGRENVFLRPNGDRNEERSALDAGSRNQPGAAAAVARSGAGDHQEEQACRAARVRSGAEADFAAEIAAGVVRDRPRSVPDDAGRARAGSVFRALHRVCGGQIARHRHRIPVARSRTCRARRQLDRRRLSCAAAECAAGAGEGRGPMAVGRNRKSAQEGRGSRIPRRGFPLEVEPVHRYQQHLAVQSADG